APPFDRPRLRASGAGREPSPPSASLCGRGKTRAADVGRCRLIDQSRNRIFERERLLIARAQPAKVYRSLFRLAPPADKDDRNLCEAVFTHLVVDLLVAQVRLGGQASGLQRLDDLFGIVICVRGDCRDHHLQRGKPERKMPGIVFNQYAEEPLQRPGNGAVHHYRLLLFRIRTDVEGAEALRQVEVNLSRTALPFAANGVLQGVFEFRAVESALALTDADLDAVVLTRHALQRALEDVLG